MHNVSLTLSSGCDWEVEWGSNGPAHKATEQQAAGLWPMLSCVS